MSFFNSADKIICISNKLKQILVNYGISKDKILVIHNGIDKKFKPLKNNPLKKRFNLRNKTVIGFVGYLNIWHGGKTLFNVLKRLMKKYEPETFNAEMDEEFERREKKLENISEL